MYLDLWCVLIILHVLRLKVCLNDTSGYVYKCASLCYIHKKLNINCFAV
jgi:hypothetical protein